MDLQFVKLKYPFKNQTKNCIMGEKKTKQSKTPHAHLHAVKAIKPRTFKIKKQENILQKKPKSCVKW